MAESKRLRLTDEGLQNLRNALKKSAPETVRQPTEPTVNDIGGTAIFEALAPVAYLTQATVAGREKAIDDFVKKIKDGDTQMCITDQALGTANLPTRPIV